MLSGGGTQNKECWQSRSGGQRGDTICRNQEVRRAERARHFAVHPSSVTTLIATGLLEQYYTKTVARGLKFTLGKMVY